MQITNNTNYDTRYLRRLFSECEKHCFENYLEHGSGQRRITVNKCRTGWIKGYAWYNSLSLVLKLPSKYTGYKTLPKWVRKLPDYQQYQLVKPLPARMVAQVYLHEIGHNVGRHHNQMSDKMMNCNFDISWWPDEPVPLKQIVEKPKINIIEQRAVQAQRKLTAWQGKLSRAKTYVKKYQTKVRYYEKKMAANNRQAASQDVSCPDNTSAPVGLCEKR